MNEAVRESIDKAVAALLDTGEPAITYFTERDLPGKDAGLINRVWELPEPQKILRKQRADGSWKGPVKKTPVYPENHSDLLAACKAFRTLIERYEFTRDVAAIEKAAEYLFSFQTGDGDIRGFIANQYATYYTGYVLALLIRAGYEDDPRIEKGMRWLLSMRQDDGGWTIPILTHYFDGETMYRLTSSFQVAIEPDRTQPFSHNWTDMVLRAFAAHSRYRHSGEAKTAGELLKSRFFRPDVYSSYKPVRYWTRFIQWWPNLLTALESLLLMGFSKDNPAIARALEWFINNQQSDGLWKLSYDGKSDSRKDTIEEGWLALRICRVLKRMTSD